MAEYHKKAPLSHYQLSRKTENSTNEVDESSVDTIRDIEKIVPQNKLLIMVNKIVVSSINKTYSLLPTFLRPLQNLPYGIVKM